MPYSRDEQVDMLLIYGECRKNSRRARMVYVQRFPGRNHPPANYFIRLEQKFRKEELHDEDDFIISEEAETRVLAYVYFDPTVSVRQLEVECNINRESCRQILKKHGFKSYKYQIHHHLLGNDYQRRIDYCNWFLHNYEENNNFHHDILFSDESRFTNLGMFNRNNTRYWATENPRVVRENAFQERFGINIWLGMLGTRIVGPIFFYEPLTGNQYLEFLQNEIENFLTNLPGNQRNAIIFQQDGAPAHNARAVTEYLTERFGQQWLGTNGPIRWPARSPDLTPLDFFLWAYVKEKVYATPSRTLEELEGRIIAAINSIREEHLRNVLRATFERVVMCRDNNGQRFEQFL